MRFRIVKMNHDRYCVERKGWFIWWFLDAAPDMPGAMLILDRYLRHEEEGLPKAKYEIEI